MSVFMPSSYPVTFETTDCVSDGVLRLQPLRTKTSRPCKGYGVGLGFAFMAACAHQGCNAIDYYYYDLKTNWGVSWIRKYLFREYTKIDATFRCVCNRVLYENKGSNLYSTMIDVATARMQAGLMNGWCSSSYGTIHGGCDFIN
jgi:hypothetical protein